MRNNFNVACSVKTPLESGRSGPELIAQRGAATCHKQRQPTLAALLPSFACFTNSTYFIPKTIHNNNGLICTLRLSRSRDLTRFTWRPRAKLRPACG